MNSNDNLFVFMRKHNPKLADSMQAAFEKDDRGRKALGEWIAGELAQKRGLDASAIIYCLAVNLVLMAYARSMGKRGEARDSIAKLIDDTFDVVEETAIERGATKAFAEAERLAKLGDKAGAERVLMQAATAMKGVGE